MKKRDEFDHTGDILMKVNDDNSGSSNGKHDWGNNEKNRSQEPKDIYMDTILSLMEKILMFSITSLSIISPMLSTVHHP